MTQIENTAIQRQRTGFSRHKMQPPVMDMTPMVDLGFLLITFFVFTTTVSTPAAMSLFMPNDKIMKDPNNLPETLALTFLLAGQDRVYYYHGSWENALKENKIFQTSYSFRSGMGEIIRQKQKSLDAAAEVTGGMMLLIKPAFNAAYRNVIDALDEVMINKVKKYAVMEPCDAELRYLKSQGNNSSR
jgi:hypothetical protein